jgi:hypothetical protein
LDLPPAPEPEDFFASTNSFLEVILRATDDNGLTGEVSQFVHPMQVSVSIRSEPIGMDIDVEGEPVRGDTSIVSWSEHELHLVAADQLPYLFLAWEDGVKERERVVKLNRSNPSFTATFCLMEEGACSHGSECCSGQCDEGRCVAELLVTGSPSLALSQIPSFLPSAAPAKAPNAAKHSTNQPTRNRQFGKPSTEAPTNLRSSVSKVTKSSSFFWGPASIVVVVLVATLAVLLLSLSLVKLSHARQVETHDLGKQTVVGKGGEIGGG